MTVLRCFSLLEVQSKQEPLLIVRNSVMCFVLECFRSDGCAHCSLDRFCPSSSSQRHYKCARSVVCVSLHIFMFLLCMLLNDFMIHGNVRFLCLGCSLTAFCSIFLRVARSSIISFSDFIGVQCPDLFSVLIERFPLSSMPVLYAHAKHIHSDT